MERQRAPGEVAAQRREAARFIRRHRNQQDQELLKKGFSRQYSTPWYGGDDDGTLGDVEENYSENEERGRWSPSDGLVHHEPFLDLEGGVSGEPSGSGALADLERPTGSLLWQRVREAEDAKRKVEESLAVQEVSWKEQLDKLAAAKEDERRAQAQRISALTQELQLLSEEKFRESNTLQDSLKSLQETRDRAGGFLREKLESLAEENLSLEATVDKYKFQAHKSDVAWKSANAEHLQRLEGIQEAMEKLIEENVELNSILDSLSKGQRSIGHSKIQASSQEELTLKYEGAQRRVLLQLQQEKEATLVKAKWLENELATERRWALAEQEQLVQKLLLLKRQQLNIKKQNGGLAWRALEGVLEKASEVETQVRSLEAEKQSMSDLAAELGEQNKQLQGQLASAVAQSAKLHDQALIAEASRAEQARQLSALAAENDILASQLKVRQEEDSRRPRGHGNSEALRGHPRLVAHGKAPEEDLGRSDTEASRGSSFKSESPIGAAKFYRKEQSAQEALADIADSRSKAAGSEEGKQGKRAGKGGSLRRTFFPTHDGRSQQSSGDEGGSRHQRGSSGTPKSAIGLSISRFMAARKPLAGRARQQAAAPEGKGDVRSFRAASSSSILPGRPPPQDSQHDGEASGRFSASPSDEEASKDGAPLQGAPPEAAEVGARSIMAAALRGEEKLGSKRSSPPMEQRVDEKEDAIKRARRADAEEAELEQGPREVAEEVGSRLLGSEQQAQWVARLKALQGQISQMEGLQQRCDRLQAEISSKEASLQALQEAASDRHDQPAAPMAHALDTALRDVKEKARQVLDLESRLQESTAETTSLRQKLQELQAAMEDSKIERQGGRGEGAVAVVGLSAANGSASPGEAEDGAGAPHAGSGLYGRKEEDRLGSEVEELPGKREDDKVEIEMLRRQAVERGVREVDLELELHRREQSLVELKKQLQEADVPVRPWKAEVAGLRRTQKELQEENAALRWEAKKLKERLGGLEEAAPQYVM